ncbi:MAG: hypothetical protein WKF58_01905 [Ilumatobacteraceae bacterium]
MTAVGATMLARAPKVLLHDHLDGGVRPETVIELAQEYGYDALPTHRRRRPRPRGSTAAPSATTSCSTSRRSPTPSA